MLTMFTKTCPQCGKQFETRFKKVIRCSRECLYDSTKKSDSRNCAYCGEVFTCLPSRKDQFCSQRCAWSGGKGNRTHGETRTRLYGIWVNMKARCYVSSLKCFPCYGGRGISVCDEWRNSYEMFRDWARSAGYRDTLTIDRKDPNGNYEPNNCRWATAVQQARNTRKRSGEKISSRFKGVQKVPGRDRWQVHICKKGRPVYIGQFDSEVEAAKAYDRAAKRAYREFAYLNFQDNKNQQPAMLAGETN